MSRMYTGTAYSGGRWVWGGGGGAGLGRLAREGPFRRGEEDLGGFVGRGVDHVHEQLIRRQAALEALPVNVSFAVADPHTLRSTVGNPFTAVGAEEFVEVPREGFPGLTL
jgi:hypothetical protein